MFLDVTMRKNPQLVEAGLRLHQTGQILPDTYVLDLDAIENNTRLLVESATKNQIELFFMTKQFGRNPYVAQKIHEAGIKKVVVVDYKEALVMMKQGLPLGNVGHLVQIPKYLLKKIMDYGTDYITVFSTEMINNIATVARELGIQQKILLKVIEPGDEIYEGQFGGFHLNELTKVIEIVKQEGIIVGGITSFPCFLFDGVSELQPTHNVETIKKAITILKQAGFAIKEVNMPSATCSRTIPFIHELGGTQGEPGHALTGTTPLHAQLELPEKPAILYVSEISHNLDGHGYFYGGGYYRRGHLESVMISTDDQKLAKDEVIPFGNDSIDYYLSTKLTHEVGATVLAAFRTQIFVTRSDVAVVSGIQTGQPRIEGIYDSLGKQIRR